VDAAGDDARARVEAVYRADSRRVLATLIRRLGGFDLAEEALSEAFAEALRRWPEEGVPAQPRAWLVAAGRFRALDALRRRARLDASLAAVAERLERESREASSAPGLAALEGELVDDRLRLVFACCHPRLAPEARVALTLREVSGLATEEIARAFLAAPSTIAQRIVRAKAKLREERVPYEVPGPSEWPARLDAVLQVVYLVFTEGHHASSGAELVRADLCGEALRLGRLLVDLLGDEGGAPREPEAAGLLALMLLNDARRAARVDAAGELVPLEEQDRGRWDRARIAEGVVLVERALATRRFGTYTLQAAIAAVHAEAPTAGATDWAQIVGLYDLLLRATPTPVVALNRAVAVAMRDGPAAGLALVDGLLAGRGDGELARYVPAHAARADLCRRLGRAEEARASYRRALSLAEQAAERRFFERRLAELGGGAGCRVPHG